jgi:peptidoglycan/LPS O-acetylase OafA/YrhL
LKLTAYRADIDGLRAVAVLAVMIYHAKSNWLPGGYVGVDMFFVISGFLITSIIHQEISSGKFNLKKFYVRRVKRILPMLFTVIFSTMVLSFFILSPEEYKEFSKSARDSSFFISNIYFARDLNYFSPSAEEMPLLHLWSLAVEEQYYFVWPFLLLILSKFFRSHTIAISAVICALSFILASVMALDSELAKWSYYLLPTRFGELLLGSILALYKPPSTAKYSCIASYTGLLLISGSLLLLNKNSVFPGYNALWPCLGMVLIIYSGRNKQVPFINRLLSLKPLVFIGLLSYSLYLWHWPLLAYARYYTMQSDLPYPWITLCIFLTFILSYLSWRYIENPVRKQQLSFFSASIKYFVIPALIILIASLIIKKTDGYLWRDNSQGLDSISSSSLVCHNKITGDCKLGFKSKQATAILIGDSHAAHTTTFFDLLAQHQQWSLAAMSSDSCHAIPNIKPLGIKNIRHSRRCQEMIKHIANILPSYKHVFIALRWDLHFGLSEVDNYEVNVDFQRQLEDQLKNFIQDSNRVYLVAQIPKYERNVYRAQRSINSINTIDFRYQEANKLLANMAGKYDHVYYLSFNKVLEQWPNGIVNNLPAYKDSNHLNVYGQGILFKEISSRESLNWLKENIKSQ